MTVEQTQIVDAIGVETATGLAVLTISDHLSWHDDVAHLETLQAKLNAYLAFLESGEVYRAYPASEGRKFRIDVVFRLQPPSSAEVFLETARGVIEGAGFGLSWRVLPE